MDKTLFVILLLGTTANKTRPEKNSKRSLFDDNIDEKELQLVESLNSSKAKKSTKDFWNDVHCDLIRDLEKKGKGTMPRYSVRHLKVWTDHIIEGKSVGVGDEPRWENLIDLVGVPPKQGREKKNNQPRHQQ